jgi:hypothetical protein
MLHVLDAMSCRKQMSGIAEPKFPYHHGHVLHFNCLWFHFELSSTFTHRTKGLQNTAQVKTKSSGQSYIINWEKNDETQEESWMQYKLEYIALWKERKEKEMNQTKSNQIDVESNQRERYIYIYPNVGFSDDLLEIGISFHPRRVGPLDSNLVTCYNNWWPTQLMGVDSLLTYLHVLSQ